MHQYTKYLYIILTSNFEILKVKIVIQALYDNSKRYSIPAALYNETTLKQFPSFLKRIELWNKNLVPGILLLDGRFAYTYIQTKSIFLVA